MRYNDAVNYIKINGKLDDNALPGQKFSVRFPKFYSERIFYSDDDYDLTNQLYNFANTHNGNMLWCQVMDQYISEEELAKELEYEDAEN